MSTPQKLKIADIGYEPKYYPRVNGKEDWYTVNIYREALVANPQKANHRTKGAFPPIHVVKVTPKARKQLGLALLYLLIDGLHRIRAFHQAGLEHIWAHVEVIPESKWFVRSVELNRVSKRAFDTGDKAFIAKTLTAQGWQLEQVAELLQMKTDSLKRIYTTRCQRVKTTRAVKNRPKTNGNRQSRSCRDIGGEQYGFLKAPFANAGLAGTSKGNQALAVQKPLTSQHIVGVLDSAIGVLKTGGLDMADEEIVGRLQSLEHLLADTLSTVTV